MADINASLHLKRKAEIVVDSKVSWSNVCLLNEQCSIDNVSMASFSNMAVHLFRHLGCSYVLTFALFDGHQFTCKNVHI